MRRLTMTLVCLVLVGVACARYGSDDTYASTPNFRDNHFCGPWATLLDSDIGPTLGYDPCNIDETHGAASVPWGDARHAAENPGFNLQSTWGGNCP